MPACRSCLCSVDQQEDQEAGKGRAEGGTFVQVLGGESILPSPPTCCFGSSITGILSCDTVNLCIWMMISWCLLLSVAVRLCTAAGCASRPFQSKDAASALAWLAAPDLVSGTSFPWTVQTDAITIAPPCPRMLALSILVPPRLPGEQVRPAHSRGSQVPAEPGPALLPPALVSHLLLACESSFVVSFDRLRLDCGSCCVH